MQKTAEAAKKCRTCGELASVCTCYELKEMLYRFIPFWYSGAGVTRAIYRIKRSADSEFTRFFARIIVNEIIRRTNAPELGFPFDAVTYVPRSNGAKRRYGTDQAQNLAAAIAEMTGLPCVPLLGRSRRAVSQKTLTYEGRLANSLNLFVASADAAGYARVLLVDDVITSGATVTSCARALKSAGVKKVSVAAIAKTLPITKKLEQYG